MEYLEMLEKLIKDKKYSLSDGVEISCAEKLNLSVFRVGVDTIIRFESPFVYVHLSKLGPLNILNIKRKIDSIKIGPKTFTICIDNFPDITKNR